MSLDTRQRVGYNSESWLGTYSKEEGSTFLSMRPPTPKSGFESAPSSTLREKVLRLPFDTAVIWGAVIPAKAGIHTANLRKCAVGGLGSRFRGNDFLHRPTRKINFPLMTSIPFFGQNAASGVEMKVRDSSKLDEQCGYVIENKW